jgi:hypothetical protein
MVPPPLTTRGGSHGGGSGDLTDVTDADDHDHRGIPRRSIDPVSYMMTARDDSIDGLSLDSDGQLGTTQPISEGDTGMIPGRRGGGGGGAVELTPHLALGGKGGDRTHVGLVRLWDLSDAMRSQVSGVWRSIWVAGIQGPRCKV